MQERSYTTIDKSEWAPGPWQEEPDKIQWKDKETGLPCLAKRNHHGVWCGYVGVSESHPYYLKPYQDIGHIFVHGGLTYSDLCQEGDESIAICHIPEPGEPDDVWWFGFDCGHAGDLMPGLEAREAMSGMKRLAAMFGERNKYRDIDYVRGECAVLADQLASL